MTAKTPVIKFSLCPIEPHKGEEWEKIQKRKVRQEFTTFRGYTWRKHYYYLDKVGHTFDVLSDGKMVGKAVLKEVFIPCNMYFISDEDLRKDTFSDLQDPSKFFQRLLVKFYGFPSIYLIGLVFEWTEVIG